ncbi:pentatricopeptide (PPR) repeat-containing protein [Wolffia australiana]
MALNSQKFFFTGESNAFYSPIPRFSVVSAPRRLVSFRPAFLEKEANFTPAFDDYVKVLESIRIDRSKTDGADSNDNLPSSNARTRDKSVRIHLQDANKNNRSKQVLRERRGIQMGKKNAQTKEHFERETLPIRAYASASKGSLGRGNPANDYSEFSKVDDGVEEKAAFKSFEVFTDVRNRPRVLRMELEEKIQNLAKRLNASDVHMPEWKFSRIMHSEGIKFTDHSVLRVVQLLGNFGNWKRVLQVVEWVQSRQPFESYKSRYIYTTVLSVLGKAKRHIEALNVFYSMRKELSSYPDLAAYHCIAVILGQAGMMKELFDVIDCMRSFPENKVKLGLIQKWDPRLEPDLVVFNAVLNACVQQKQWEGAFWVLQELKKKGIKPSNTTLGLVMEVMFVSGKYNLVHEFFDKIQKSSVPGALSYKVLVNTFWREGKVDEAVHAVKEMESRGVVGSASLYYDLARCLCSSGRCQEALKLIDKICKVASKPLVVTYTGLIQACLDSGSIENAAYIFNQMTNFCSPNVVTCNIMLKSYAERGMFQEAKHLFQRILARDGLTFVKETNLEEKKISPDKFTFNTMLEACMAAESWDDFEYVYDKMLKWGHPFNARRHLRMVMEASRAGKESLLETTYHHLIQSGRTPPPALLKVKPSLQ